MTDSEFDDGVRWRLVRPAGLVGLVEALMRGLERWICARARAQAMAGIASAVADAGVRADITVVEDEDAYWTLIVEPPALTAAMPTQAEAQHE
jgi:hypothetical protein